MSCRRAIEIDLAGFLAEPRAPEYADFRDHYPRCPACAAELRVWTELQRELGASRAHPVPERLAEYARAADSVEPDARRTLEAHLARCAPCRDELNSLARFDPAALRAASESDARTDGAARQPLLGRVRAWLWQPALAYGLASALLVTLVWNVWRSEPEPAAGPVVASAQRRAGEPRADAAEGVRAPRLEKEAPEKAAKSAGRVAPAPEPPAAAPEPEAARSPRSFAALEATPSEAADAEEVAPESPPRAAREARARLLADRPAAQPREEKSTLAGAGIAQMQASEADRVAPLRLELRSGRVLRISARAAEQPLRLAVPVPPDAPLPGDAELRLRDASGRRELRERQTWHTAPVRLEISVPEGWLRPGAYRVEFVPAEGAPQEFALEVLAP